MFLITAPAVFAQDFNSCKALFNQQQYFQSSQCFNELLSTDRSNGQIRFWYATSLYYQNNYDASIKEFEYIARVYQNQELGKTASAYAEKVRQKKGNENTTPSASAPKAIQKGVYVNTLKTVNRWGRMPVNVWIEPHKFTPYVKRAFTEWQIASDQAVRFNYVPRNKAQIEVVFVQKAKTTTIGLTSTQYTPDSHKMLHAKIQLAQYDMQNHKLTDTGIYRVALHEIGHALGMGGHSKNPIDLMYPTLHKRLDNLSKNDIATIKYMYGR